MATMRPTTFSDESRKCNSGTRRNLLQPIRNVHLAVSHRDAFRRASVNGSSITRAILNLSYLPEQRADYGSETTRGTQGTEGFVRRILLPLILILMAGLAAPQNDESVVRATLDNG